MIIFPQLRRFGSFLDFLMIYSAPHLFCFPLGSVLYSSGRSTVVLNMISWLRYRLYAVILYS
jgi:hypothetical protein